MKIDLFGPPRLCIDGKEQQLIPQGDGAAGLP